ncbi:hypothetical protein JTE90_018570 [Oedothorax gibbosus]|uniref:Uncharacterized protein n=1 Tax=Oedothorax gibbosus TaxID=931172 RepID=A0AAV6U545_9ARAC|nr:hypothetical protein JTE90_018570 [Oedothorax gibbosus]
MKYHNGLLAKYSLMWVLNAVSRVVTETDADLESVSVRAPTVGTEEKFICTNTLQTEDKWVLTRLQVAQLLKVSWFLRT